ncbi:hypothetical protein AYY16_07860 [Morganella psychrotolerans]|nr:hypothetical protein AYY16_07860 [Morganella psychrotolerans]
MLFRHTPFRKNGLTTLLNVATTLTLMLFIAIAMKITVFFTEKQYIFTTKRQAPNSDSFKYELMQRPYLSIADIRSLLFISLFIQTAGALAAFSQPGHIVYLCSPSIFPCRLPAT